jgi:TolB protein
LIEGNVRTQICKLFLLTVLLGNAAYAELVIQITEGIKRRPIAVVPFGWEGSAPAVPLDIAKVISDDLNRSGRFAPIPVRDMLQKPTQGADVDFDDWSVLGVVAVVVGTVTLRGENAYTVQFQLFDV